MMYPLQFHAIVCSAKAKSVDPMTWLAERIEVVLPASGGKRTVRKILKLLIAVSVCVMLGMGSGFGLGLHAGQVPLPEYRVKAALLYKFAIFTEWPDKAFAGPAAPLQVCVLGKDPFGAALNTIVGRMVNQRQVVTSQFAGVQGVERCHVVFVSRSEEGRLAEILKHLRNQPVLVVADMQNFARAGGIVTLKLENKKLRFEINVRSAARAGLKLSSRLLMLAEIYPPEQEMRRSDAQTQ